MSGAAADSVRTAAGTAPAAPSGAAFLGELGVVGAGACQVAIVAGFATKGLVLSSNDECYYL